MPRLRLHSRLRPFVAAVPALFVLGSVACSSPVPNVFAPAQTTGSAVATDQAVKSAAGGPGAPAPAASPAAAAPVGAAGGIARQAVSQNASAPLEVQAQSAQPLDRM